MLNYLIADQRNALLAQIKPIEKKKPYKSSNKNYLNFCRGFSIIIKFIETFVRVFITNIIY